MPDQDRSVATRTSPSCLQLGEQEAGLAGDVEGRLAVARDFDGEAVASPLQPARKVDRVDARESMGRPRRPMEEELPVEVRAVESACGDAQRGLVGHPVEQDILAESCLAVLSGAQPLEEDRFRGKRPLPALHRHRGEHTPTGRHKQAMRASPTQCPADAPAACLRRHGVALHTDLNTRTGPRLAIPRLSA